MEENTQILPEQNSVIVSPPQVLPNNAKKKKLLMLGALFLVIGVSFISLSVYFSQKRQGVQNLPKDQKQVEINENDVNNWKTYTNSKYGFTLKYPSFLKPEADKGRNDYIHFLFPDKSQYIQYYIRIDFLENPDNLDPKSFFLNIVEKVKVEHLEKDYPPIPESEFVKDVDINGVSTFQFGSFAGDGNVKHIYILKNSYMIDISYYYENSNDPSLKSHLETAEMILSTFKLIDSQTKKDLKTFINKKHNFSFIYPETFLLTSTDKDCVTLISDETRISFGVLQDGVPTVSGCFPSGYGKIIDSKVLETYTLIVVGKQPVNFMDVEFEIESIPTNEKSVISSIKPNSPGWAQIELSSGNPLGIYFLIPKNSYQKNKEVIRNIVKSISFLK